MLNNSSESGNRIKIETLNTSWRPANNARVRVTSSLGGFMSRLLYSRLSVLLILGLAVTLTSLSLAKPQKISAQQESQVGQATDDTKLLDGFRHVEVASVSDALEQIAGKQMYMTHAMRP